MAAQCKLSLAWSSAVLGEQLLWTRNDSGAGSSYAQDFVDCSYGFRPGRGEYETVRELDRAVHSGRVNWMLEADFVSFFDSIDRKALMENKPAPD